MYIYVYKYAYIIYKNTYVCKYINIYIHKYIIQPYITIDITTILQLGEYKIIILRKNILSKTGVI